MKQKWMRQAAIIATAIVCSLAGSAPAKAKDVTSSSSRQFKRIAKLAGEWQVQGHASLKIVFEPTAGGNVIVERWMHGKRMHSLTIYHLDGASLIATHYCPQGNQPRLAATVSDDDEMRFTFLDATDLDPNESFQHDLSFKRNSDGTVARAEVYWGPDGARETSTLTLFLATQLQ